MSKLKAKCVVDVYDEYSSDPYKESQVYLKSEADKVIAEKDEKIAEMEEERRWRNVDDMFPTADEGYILVLWEDGLPDIGYIGAEDDVIETVRDRGEGHSVKWLMPLPSAPKEQV